ncbi:peptide ABC transporter substrate-binding protein [Alicyclobacillus vulcanalis]|uniref:Peptide/nickel transport system substrate-binding protein n=1 Tax=Alicyclobacillus vulcanalis TaxID=252246 RepID=A0A1N7K923_9BACL|nr:peptide ABC transporter substrate-binding protein [Alicyclobacillus vulcanalis]SIS58058.1 peptide/nickel transport system substrate-binding protein [Alicyclobacillus vulcanalis]
MKGQRKKHAARLGVAAATVVLGAGIIAGCGTQQNNSSNTTNSTQTTTQQPQKGGTLVVALAPSTNLNWYLPITDSANASVYNAQLQILLYPGVIYIGNNYAIDWADSFASRIDYNATGTVYTIHLKKNWVWSDGKPVTAQDVVWDYQLIKATDESNTPPWPNYSNGSGGIPQNVKSVVALDNYTVQITLKKPVNQQWFIYNGIGQLTALPEHAWNKYPNNMAQEIAYLGKEASIASFFTVVDGPFKLVSAKQSQAWVLVPNPTFGGHKSTLDKLIFQYEASADAEFAALRSGSVNLGYLDPSQWNSRNALLQMGDKIVPGYNFGYFFIELNMLKGSPMYSAFSDLKVREALEYAMNQNQIDQDVYHGFAPPLYGPIPAQPKTVYYDPSLNNLFAYNPAKAKQLLESDGWKMENGVMTKNGQKLQFTMLVSSGAESTIQEAELVQQDWKQIGVDVTLQEMPFNQEESIMSDSKNPGKWAAAAGTGITYGGSYPSGEQLFEPGGLDNFGYNDPTADKLIAKTTEPVSSQAENTKNFFAYEDYIAKQLPVLWQNVPASITVIAPNVHNATTQVLNPTTDYSLYNYIWVSSKK